MTSIRETIHSGEINKGDKRLQLYINVSVLLGFALLAIWTSLYKFTFANVWILLFIIIFPSLIVSLFLLKKYISICGYSQLIKNNFTYNFLIRILVFILIAMPVGNLSAFIFLYSNLKLAAETVKSVIVIPQEIYESISKRTKYRSYEITYDGTNAVSLWPETSLGAKPLCITELCNNTLNYSLSIN